MGILRLAGLLLLLETVRAGGADMSEAVGTCGTRGDVKKLIFDILCREPKDVRKILTDKMWRCKSGSLEADTLKAELVSIARQDEDRSPDCMPLPAVGPGGIPGGGGMLRGAVQVAQGNMAAGQGVMDPTDTPCTRESIDRIYMQILCREPSSKEAFGRNWQCKNGKLGDRKLTNMLTHFVLIGREQREGDCGPLPGVAGTGGFGGGRAFKPPMGTSGGAAGGGSGGFRGGMGGGSGAAAGVATPMIRRPSMAAQEAPLPPDECPAVVSEAFQRILCRDPNMAEKTAAVWRCRKHSESRDRVFASLAFLSRKFSVVSECPGGGYGE